MAVSPHNLVWIDLEMTGLDPQKDVILEIAVLITDNDLVILDKGGLSLVVHQPDATIAAMNGWCKTQHGKSGLIEDVHHSTVTLADAEAQTCDYIARWCAPQTAPLCGNTVFQDRTFLRAYMPRVDALLHYRIIDVSSVKELVRRWYPKDKVAHFAKQDRHRALSDINESLAELRHYRNHFFK